MHSSREYNFNSYICCTLVRYQPEPSVSGPLAFPSASQTPPLLHDASDVLARRGKERKRGRESGGQYGVGEEDTVSGYQLAAHYRVHEGNLAMSSGECIIPAETN